MPDAMTTKIYRVNGQHHGMKLVWVPGTGGQPYLFGGDPRSRWIHVEGCLTDAHDGCIGFRVVLAR